MTGNLSFYTTTIQDRTDEKNIITVVDSFVPVIKYYSYKMQNNLKHKDQ